MPAVANCDGRDVLIAADGATVLRREGANDIEVATSIKSYGFGNLAARTIGFLVRASLRDIDNHVFAGPTARLRPGRYSTELACWPEDRRLDTARKKSRKKAVVLARFSLQPVS